MKVRQSGMPEEKVWNEFFNVDLILSSLKINFSIRDAVEIGCGYGTFTIPLAQKICGKLFTFDIEPEMLEFVKEKSKRQYISNIRFEHRDVLSDSTGLPDSSVDHVLLFNILHNETPVDFLTEAHRILKQNGKLGIIHWRSDIATPRGPDLDIRPKPEQILGWINNHQFNIERSPFILEPWHFGVLLSKR